MKTSALILAGVVALSRRARKCCHLRENVVITIANHIVKVMLATRRPMKSTFVLSALLWSGTAFASPFLLPSQEKPNFLNARMCRNHKVLSGILTAAMHILKTRVTVAGSDGPKTAHDPDDIYLEAVSILDDDKAAIFCSVTIAAKGITERAVYSVGPTGTPGSYGNSWIVKFGGNHGPSGGGHELFPEMIQVQPGDGPGQAPTSTRASQ
jgi:hypothetical protein